MRTTHVYRIGKRFADDRWERDLGASDRIVHETGSHYFVRMTNRNAEDMLSDAEYYSDAVGFDPDYIRYFMKSAQATAKALREQIEQIAERGYTNHDRKFAPGYYEEVSA